MSLKFFYRNRVLSSKKADFLFRHLLGQGKPVETLQDMVEIVIDIYQQTVASRFVGLSVVMKMGLGHGLFDRLELKIKFFDLFSFDGFRGGPL